MIKSKRQDRIQIRYDFRDYPEGEMFTIENRIKELEVRAKLIGYFPLT